MKRAHRQLNGGEEASRVKRRKDAVAGSSSDIDITSSDPIGEERVATWAGDVRERGLKLWQTVRDATNKEGRILSIDFFRKPSKKLYPDYYVFIQHPIALEDIKKQLESNYYPTLEAVRQDFELCFENAKTYNMKESDIWKDAKDLLKLTNKTYHKMVPTTEEGEPTGKQPSLHRIAKARLNKIIEKTDDTGRVLSDIFMELPSKKLWPQYYVQIKRPQCLEAIAKKVRKKDYPTMTDFADDVELVFSNAMDFNQEHTQIWEDALSLRDTFRHLMADLPPQFAVALYQKPTPAKIKIKMPVTSAAAASTATAGTSSSPPTANMSSVRLRVPGATASKASTPAVMPVPLPVPTPPPAPRATTSPVLLPNTLPSTNMIQPTPQPKPTLNTTTTTFAHYPKASYLPGHTPAPAATAPVTAPPPPPVVNSAPAKTLSLSNSPAPPPIHPRHMLKVVSLMTEPSSRPFLLDHQDGVKTWAMRLGPGERAIRVADVTYMGDEEEDSSEEDTDDWDEEDDEEEDEDSDTVMKNGKKKGKGKGRSPTKRRVTTAAVKALQAARAAKREARKFGEVQVKLNGNVVPEKADRPGQWFVDLQAGSNLLEVGEKGGLIWKVYAERLVV